MTNEAHTRSYEQAVNAAKEKIALIKAAWETFKHQEDKPALSQVFSCTGEHVLCKPIEPALCDCEKQPVAETESVNLVSYQGHLVLIIHPSLESNQPYLDLLQHSPFHCTQTEVSVALTTTFADVAAAAGNLDVIQHLFTSSSQCVRQFYAEYYTYQDPSSLLKLFVHALNGENQKVVKFLVAKFSEQLTSDLKVSILETCLWLATKDKKLAMCFEELVLKFGVNIVDSRNMFCPLRLTCVYDNGEAAAFLINHGADMYAVNASGRTIVFHAYKCGRYGLGLHSVLRTMLDKGLNVEATMVQGSNFRFPLMYILLNHGEVDLVRYLVSSGYHVNSPICIFVDDEEHLITPLMHALFCRCFQIASWLIEQGADVNKRSFSAQQLEDESWTPLHMAATLGNMNIFQKLIKYGADVDATTAGGETVMSLAVEKAVKSCSESLSMVSYLIQINAPVQSIPGHSSLVELKLEEAVKNDWTMLDLAVYSANTDVVDILLKGGHYPRHCPPKLSDFLELFIQPVFCQQRKAMKFVEVFARQIPSLQSLCRDSLRAACGLHLLQYMNTTVLPARLRSYLLLEDVLGPFERQCEDQVTSS